MSILKKVQHLQWISNLTTRWKFLPWTHEIPPQGGFHIPPRLGTTELHILLWATYAVSYVPLSYVSCCRLQISLSMPNLSFRGRNELSMGLQLQRKDQNHIIQCCQARNQYYATLFPFTKWGVTQLYCYVIIPCATEHAQCTFVREQVVCLRRSLFTCCVMVQSVAVVPRRNSHTHLYVAKLRCRRTADSQTALATALKLFFRFAGFLNLASVISFPYFLQYSFHYCLSFRGCHQAWKMKL